MNGAKIHGSMIQQGYSLAQQNGKNSSAIFYQPLELEHGLVDAPGHIVDILRCNSTHVDPAILHQVNMVHLDQVIHLDC